MSDWFHQPLIYSYIRVDSLLRESVIGNVITSRDQRCLVLLAAHSPDNSFMGFVVEQHLNDTTNVEPERKAQAVVYGKSEYMWQVGRRTSLIYHVYMAKPLSSPCSACMNFIICYFFLPP